MSEQNKLNIKDLIKFPVNFCERCLQLEDAGEKAVLKHNRFNDAAENLFVGEWIANTLNGAAEREAEIERLKGENGFLKKQLEHVNSHPNMDGAKHYADLMSIAAQIVIDKPKHAAYIQTAVDCLKTYDSQKEKIRLEMFRENERLKGAVDTVLRHIASHQVYDKDSARTLKMALEG